MYYPLASNLAVAYGSPAVSQAVPMSGANAIEVNIDVTVIGSAELTVAVQVSNDLANWEVVDTVSSEAVGAVTAAFTGLAATYVRLHYEQQSGGIAILSGGLWTGDL